MQSETAGFAALTTDLNIMSATLLVYLLFYLLVMSWGVRWKIITDHNE
jgi:hypothetical protein